MKIVIVSSYRIGNETGTAKVSERLSKHLAKKHQVLYLCLGEKYALVKSSTKNLYLLTIPSEIVSGLGVPIITPNTVRKIYKDLDRFTPNVIHAQNIAFSGLIALIWAKENRVPFVLTFHSLPSEGVSYVFPKFKNKKIISTIDYNLSTSYVREFTKHVDLIICLNKSVLKSVNQIKTKTKTVIINNGLDLKLFNSIKRNPPQNQTNCIYLGSYLGRKNQEYLLKAFSFLPNNFNLNLYGSKNSGRFYVKKLESIINRNKIINVHINDYIDGEKVLEVLNASHYFVSASIKEVQSLVVVEALAAGIPIIGLENETINELIDGKNGLKISKKTSPLKFAKLLQDYVKKTNTNYQNISDRCRQSVSRFDIDRVSDQLIKSYKAASNIQFSKKTDENQILLKLKKIIPENYFKYFEFLMPNSGKKKTNILKALLSLTVVFSIITGGIALIASKMKDNK